MKPTKYLQVVDRVEKVSDNNGKTYAVIALSTPNRMEVNIPGQGMVAIKQKPETIRGITGFEESNLPSLNSEPDYEWDLQKGDYVVGDRVTREVEPYFIPDTKGTPKDKQGPVKQDGKTGRIVSVATCAVLADTADEAAFEVAIQRAFANKRHVLVNSTATQKADAKKAVPTDEEEDDEPEVETVVSKKASKSK